MRRTPSGNYTAFGVATELVDRLDGALAIIGSGEEIHLEFPVPPPPPPGFERYFAIEFHGWAKDMDLYTRDGHTLVPLPIPEDIGDRHRMRRDLLHERHNVRFRGGHSLR